MLKEIKNRAAVLLLVAAGSCALVIALRKPDVLKESDIHVPEAQVIQNHEYLGVEIFSNNPVFTIQIARSLELLRLRAKSWNQISKVVSRVREGERSGTLWLPTSPAVVEISGNDAFHSLSWCAGLIAHEAERLRTFNQFDQNDPQARRDQEKKYIRFRVKIMKEIGAPKDEVDWVLQHTESPRSSK